MKEVMEDTVMTSERRRLLDKHLDTWTQSLQLDDVMVFLLSNSVFNEHIVDIIKSESTVAMQRYQFIRQLKMRGNTAFSLFYQSLLKTNQRYLAHLMESGLSSEDKNNVGQEIEYKSTLHNNPSTGENCQSIACHSPTPAAIQRNCSYYRSYECVKMREPAGILHDLMVDFIDTAANLSSFDANLVYPNFSSPRGVALIINNRYFLDMPERIGTDVDEINLNNLFRQLNYAVSVCRNLCAKEMLIAIQDFSKRPEHKHLDSCVVCVLTHGEHGELYGTDDVAISVLEFVSCLNARNCPALAHKPKLFFLQACRGQQYDRGFGTEFDGPDGYFDRWFTCTTSQPKSSLPMEQKTKSPIEADILVSYATTPGYVSWRNSMKGSWFVQSICEVFAKYAKSTDILSMLTLVNKQVADAFESSSGSFKQIPDHSSRLRKAFYFFPGTIKPF
uniref:BMA-CED-3 n=2 Tax=Brugia malayi TaxID=6279 RepID=A0A0H5S967_BRUMA|nr:BMA-CED-3 [Brugia malayi]